MRHLGRDVFYAIRRLKASPLFTLFAVVTLGLGIGAATAAYSVIYAVAFKPPAIDAVEQVVKLYHADGGSAPMVGFSWLDFDDLKRQQRSFSHVAAWSRFDSAVVLPGGARSFLGEFVDGDYFNTLRVVPMHGRLILGTDDTAGAPPVVVLGEEFWRSAFGGDPAVVGRVLTIGGANFTVVGVAPPGARGVDVPNLAAAAMWIPIRQRQLLARPGYQQYQDEDDRNRRWVRGIARLHDGGTLERANLELRQLGVALDASAPLGTDLEPRYRSHWDRQRGWFARRLIDIRIHESMGRVVDPVLSTVLVAVTLVLLVACTNLANLLLARGAARRHEFAIRRALGASRGRLLREQLTECTLLAFGGGVVGVLVARGLVILLTADFNVGDSLTMIISVRPELNAQAMTVATAATVLALIVCGVVPAWHSTGADVRSALVTDAGGAVPRWRGRRMLIAVQVMASVALLALTAVSAGNASRLTSRSPGFPLEQLAVVVVNPSAGSVTSRDAQDALTRAAAFVGHMSGIRATTVATALPVGTGIGSINVIAAGSTRGPWLRLVEAGAGYVDTIGFSLLHGRDLREEDLRRADAVVLSAGAAEQLFGRTDAIGQRVVYRRQPYLGEPTPVDVEATVIGVVNDTHDSGRPESQDGLAIIPLSHATPARRLTVVARTTAPDTAIDRLRSAVVSADARLPVMQVSTGASLIDGFTVLLRIVGSTAGLMGGFAMLLALVGLYGVLSFVVARRGREIGVRMALGAERASVRRMVLRDGLGPVLWGIALGTVLIAPVLLSPLGQSMLRLESGAAIYGILAPVTMLVAAIAAMWFPARRASMVDPNVVLRQE